jgi:hypothetical protein
VGYLARGERDYCTGGAGVQSSAFWKRSPFTVSLAAAPIVLRSVRWLRLSEQNSASIPLKYL